MQDFNGVWTRDLAITGAMFYQLSYEATGFGSRSIIIVGWSPEFFSGFLNFIHCDNHFFIFIRKTFMHIYNV